MGVIWVFRSFKRDREGPIITCNHKALSCLTRSVKYLNLYLSTFLTLVQRAQYTLILKQIIFLNTNYFYFLYERQTFWHIHLFFKAHLSNGSICEKKQTSVNLNIETFSLYNIKVENVLLLETWNYKWQWYML